MGSGKGSCPPLLSSPFSFVGEVPSFTKNAPLSKGAELGRGSGLERGFPVEVCPLPHRFASTLLSYGYIFLSCFTFGLITLAGGGGWGGG